MNKKLFVIYTLFCLLFLSGFVVPKQVTALPTPDIAPLLVADFDSCAGINNLGGQMGAAFQPPHNQLSEVYVPEAGRGCKVKLVYQIRDWGSLWMKLPNLDLSQFRENNGVLTFDIRADEPIPYGMQIELKRFCVPDEGCGELSVYFMTGIMADWQTRSVRLEGFGSTGWAPPLSSWTDVEELVFTFAFPTAGNNGTVHLDNIRFALEPNQLDLAIPTISTPSASDSQEPPSEPPVDAEAHPIYSGGSLTTGYDMGVDTSGGLRNWVSNVNGQMCMAYPINQDWGAVFITVGPPTNPPRPGTDLSQYQTLLVELRGESGGEFVSVGVKDNTDPDDGSERKYIVSNLTSEWQSISIPLSHFTATADLTRLYVVTEFVFEPGTPAETVCFRNIQDLP